MFKNRFLLVLSLFSLLLVTMAVSRPFSSAPVSSVAGANDFYQRHRNWNRNLEASDYYERHPERSESIAVMADSSGDFALRHPEWTIRVQNAEVPVTGNLDTSDYFQRHPAVRTSPTLDLSDYFLRH